MTRPTLVARDRPATYAPDRARRKVIGVGILGAITLAEFVIGVAVIL